MGVWKVMHVVKKKKRWEVMGLHGRGHVVKGAVGSATCDGVMVKQQPTNLTHLG